MNKKGLHVFIIRLSRAFVGAKNNANFQMFILLQVARDIELPATQFLSVGELKCRALVALLTCLYTKSTNVNLNILRN